MHSPFPLVALAKYVEPGSRESWSPRPGMFSLFLELSGSNVFRKEAGIYLRRDSNSTFDLNPIFRSQRLRRLGSSSNPFNWVHRSGSGCHLESGFLKCAFLHGRRIYASLLLGEDFGMSLSDCLSSTAKLPARLPISRATLSSPNHHRSPQVFHSVQSRDDMERR